ncbi:MAG: LysR family transcriptional regulator [Lawsonibacter sp.]|nr:LysR family transcriptional regulator [Lawsonibacter sp.]
MTLLQIQYFIEVQKWRSFSVAAEKNFVSQPTISAAVTQLEAETGRKLFHRGKPLTLTEEGREFFYHCKGLLEHYDFVCGLKKREEHIIRIGISPMISAILLPEIIRKAGGTTVKLSERYREELIRSLNNGSIDVLFIYDIWIKELDFAYKPIRPIRRALSAHRRFALPDRPLRAADLKGVPLALRTRDSFLNTAVRDDFDEAGIQPSIICETDQIKTLELIISTGSGAAFLDGSLFAGQPDVYSYPYLSGRGGTDALHISLVFKKGQSFPRHIRSFIDAF